MISNDLLSEFLTHIVLPLALAGAYWFVSSVFSILPISRRSSTIHYEYHEPRCTSQRCTLWCRIKTRAQQRRVARQPSRGPSRRALPPCTCRYGATCTKECDEMRLAAEPAIVASSVPRPARRVIL